MAVFIGALSFVVTVIILVILVFAVCVSCDFYEKEYKKYIGK